MMVSQKLEKSDAVSNDAAWVRIVAESFRLVAPIKKLRRLARRS